MKVRYTLLLICLYMVPAQSFAQAPNSPGQPMTRDKIVSRTLSRQVNHILMGTFCGGVLGLSTLSFYGRPQDKLSVIPIGMALGTIIGAVYSTAQVATNPDDYLAAQDYSMEPRKFEYAYAPSLRWSLKLSF